jgi:hypothetical protein
MTIEVTKDLTGPHEQRHGRVSIDADVVEIAEEKRGEAF